MTMCTVKVFIEDMENKVLYCMYIFKNAKLLEENVALHHSIRVYTKESLWPLSADSQVLVWQPQWFWGGIKQVIGYAGAHRGLIYCRYWCDWSTKMNIKNVREHDEIHKQTSSGSYWNMSVRDLIHEGFCNQLSFTKLAMTTAVSVPFSSHQSRTSLQRFS